MDHVKALDSLRILMTADSAGYQVNMQRGASSKVVVGCFC